MSNWIFLVGIIFSLSAEASTTKLLYSCKALNSREIGQVSVYSFENRQYSLGIEWIQPAGREDIEEAEAFPLSDHTVDGYETPKINAALLFYTADDTGGERQVLEIDGVETPVQCQWVGR